MRRLFPLICSLVLSRAESVWALQAIGSGKQLWTRSYPGCAGLLESAIARDSTAFVRAGRELAALLTGVASYVLGADGELRSRVTTTRK